MANYYLNLEIGGKQRGLNFKIGAVKRLKEASGKDLLKGENPFDGLDTLETVELIIYATAANNCDVKREPVDFTPEDVKVWVNDIDMGVAIQIVNTWTEATTVTGEGNGNTQR